MDFNAKIKVLWAAAMPDLINMDIKSVRRLGSLPFLSGICETVTSRINAGIDNSPI
jgi:hypothetical protein